LTVKWKFRDGKWRRINVEFEEQVTKTRLLSTVIRAIYDNDSKLTPAEQQEAIMDLSGMSAAEMESIVRQYHDTEGTTDDLANSIRAVISKHRATNRTDKDKNKVS